MALVGERWVWLGVVLTVRLVLAVGGVRGEVLLRVVGVMRSLAVVVLVVMAAAAAASSSCAGGVLVGAGRPCLLAGVAGHPHQSCRDDAGKHHR